MHTTMAGPQPAAFTYDALAGRVVFGVGRAPERLRDEVERLGAVRLLAIFGEPERELAERLLAPLSELVAGTFTDVRPHVPVEVATAARAAAERVRADGLLSIGGGSTTGTAKAVALATPLPILAVPTTYAGSEMTPVWGMTEARRKATGRSASVLPRTVIYDPALTLSLPADITGSSALNAIAHCVEAFYARGANPVTSLLAEEGIRALAAGARRAVVDLDDLDARGDLLFGAFLAARAFAEAGSGLHHTICHVLGGAYDLPHAETHAIVLPHALAFNEPAMPAIAARIHAALAASSDADGRGPAAERLYDLIERIGVPTALADLDMPEGGIADVAEQVVAVAWDGNPRPLRRAGVERLLRAAFAGRRPVVDDVQPR